ncbi:ATP-binding protein [Nesterenkonia flava]|uniref:AAA family ATPase n=1 Tax=Nesterenkonia flava TaxID=469799 RepID=A0ABU1FWF8_9MICC|nr:AAA family ATPase [Nesterenkonia flava]MDR5712582.1 AAA family ATPase [Nesterenkonia flava]
MGEPHSFVGRTEELSRIRDAAEEVRRGHTRFVVIEGVAGAGKTALVRKALEPLEPWPEYGSAPGGQPADPTRPGQPARTPHRVRPIEHRGGSDVDQPRRRFPGD